jgi:hypothetical protein
MVGLRTTRFPQLPSIRRSENCGPGPSSICTRHASSLQFCHLNWKVTRPSNKFLEINKSVFVNSVSWRYSATAIGGASNTRPQWPILLLPELQGPSRGNQDSKCLDRAEIPYSGLCADGMPIGPPAKPLCLIDPKHRACNWHALPWSVPQSGHVFEGERTQILWFYRDIPFGLDWHIACKL